MNNEPLGFGAVITSQDKRDYDLGAVTPLAARPEVYTPDYSSIPVDMQGKQPACGAHAIAFLRALKRGGGHQSPRFAWTQIKKVDGYPLESGTTINAALDQMIKRGVCNFDLTGNDVSGTLQEYANLPLTQQMLDDAAREKEESYAITYSPTFEQLKQAIYTHKGVLILLRVGANMYRPSWKTCLPLSPSAYPMDSGHFMVGHGYDLDTIYGRNEWSTEWGDNGDFRFKANYMPYVVAIGTVVNKSQLPTFYRDLSLGNTGPDVKALQQFLNTHGYTIATVGAGSPGHETDYFGMLTKHALTGFQLSNGINPPQGYFGPKTRSYINQILSEEN